MNTSTFAALGIEGHFLRALEAQQLTIPTDIQKGAIPAALKGRDVLGLAQTGSGKTVAFGLPLMQLLAADQQGPRPGKPAALIIAPTRELAAQIQQSLATFAAGTPLQLACIFGGVNQNPQVRRMRRRVDVLIATPGRLLDLMQQGVVHLDALRVLVLDEADRLLDLGFSRDIQKIVARTPKKRQTLLFSATMPTAVSRLADQLLLNPERIEVAAKSVNQPKITQLMSFVATRSKQQALYDLLQRDEVEKAVVFTRTKHGADRVVKKLNATNVVADAIHGNKSQNARTQALARFKSGESWVLVATDIAARGIDISGISHVFNFDLPDDPESYVHRIGRTARAGATGVAWTLVDDSERAKLKAIQRLTGQAPRTVKLELGEAPEETPEPAEQTAPKTTRSARPRQRNATPVERSGPSRRRHRKPSGRRVARRAQG